MTMQTRTIAFAVATALVTITVGGAAGQLGPKTVATEKEVMSLFVVPASDAVFGVIDAPTTDTGWADARRHAVALAESGNLLLIGGRAAKSGEWSTLATALVDSAIKAARAAERKDFDAFTNGSDAVAETCVACHAQYMPR